MVARLLESRDDFEVEDSGAYPGDPGIEEYGKLQLPSEVKRCKRLWPHRHGTEGFFICRLRRGRT